MLGPRLGSELQDPSDFFSVPTPLCLRELVAALAGWLADAPLRNSKQLGSQPVVANSFLGDLPLTLSRHQHYGTASAHQAHSQMPVADQTCCRFLEMHLFSDRTRGSIVQSEARLASDSVPRRTTFCEHQARRINGPQRSLDPGSRDDLCRTNAIAKHSRCSGSLHSPTWMLADLLGSNTQPTQLAFSS